jgi:hypothetical protein
LSEVIVVCFSTFWKSDWHVARILSFLCHSICRSREERFLNFSQISTSRNSQTCGRRDVKIMGEPGSRQTATVPVFLGTCSCSMVKECDAWLIEPAEFSLAGRQGAINRANSLPSHVLQQHFSFSESFTARIWSCQMLNMWGEVFEFGILWIHYILIYFVCFKHILKSFRIFSYYSFNMRCFLWCILAFWRLEGVAVFS